MFMTPTRNTDTTALKKPEEIQVGIADLKVSLSPNRIITLGLGSCVGVTFYDPTVRVGGLLHIMLPDSKQFNSAIKPAKFADTGLPLMLNEFKKLGGKLHNIQAKMAGGAQMFSGANQKLALNIGERNVDMARKVLKDMGIRVLANEVGGSRGRTMILDTTNGEVTIRTVGTPIKTI
ncbi:MAG: chemotaxis protein CheD [Peptococcaceae bacterium]|nr:chemotaxis protein CheD [Peptococcaceae bacterium]